MTILQSITKNTASRFVTEMMNRLASLVLWILISRQYGLTSFGIYAFAMSVFQFGLASSTLGLGTLITRDVARDPGLTRRYLGNVLVLGALWSMVITGFIWIGTIMIAPDIPTRKMTILITWALVPANGIYWVRSILFAYEKMEFVAFGRFVENFVRIGLVWIFLKLGYGLPIVFIIFIASKVIGFIIMIAKVLALAGIPGFRPDKKLVTMLISQVPAFGSIAVVNSLFWSVSIILLTGLRGTNEAGLFSIGLKILDIFISLALALGQSLLPILARFSSTDNHRMMTLCQTALKYLLVTAFGIIVTTMPLAGPITRLFGADMAGAVFVVQLVTWTLLPFMGIPVLAFALISKDHQKLDLCANIIALVVLITATGILAYWQGAMGAAVALFIAMSVFCYKEYQYVQRELFTFSWKSVFFKILASFTITAIFSSGLFKLNIVAGACLTPLSYTLLLYATGIIDPNDRQLINMVAS